MSLFLSKRLIYFIVSSHILLTEDEYVLYKREKIQIYLSIIRIILVFNSLALKFLLISSELVVQVLVSLVSSYRYNKELVDHSTVNLEASKLREATRTKQLDSDEFVLILSTRNIYQLKATFECYKQNYGFSIDQVSYL